MLTRFPVLELDLEFEVTRAIQFPRYAGSTLRGCLGWALRDLACLTGLASCRPCSLRHHCVHALVFETPVPPTLNAPQRFQDVPHPYVIDAACVPQRLRDGDRLAFTFRLLGTAQREAFTLIEAWRRALAGDVGRLRGAARLRRVCYRQGTRHALVWENGRAYQRADDHLVVLSQEPCASVTLDFRTPLRLQENGRILSVDEVNEEKLLMALLRRIYLLAACHTDLPFHPDFVALKRTAKQIRGERSLRWVDQERRSSRHQASTPIGGVMGRWILWGPIAPFIPLIELGHYIHVGKLAVCGLGAYDLVVSPQ